MEGFSSDSETSEMEEEGEERLQPNPLCPVIKLSKEKLRELPKPWGNAIIVKLLGKRIGMRLLKDRLSRLWNPSGDMEVIDLDFDFFVVRFANRVDYAHVFTGGPWVIMSHDLEVLHEIGKNVGRFVKVDDHTWKTMAGKGQPGDLSERAKFARICVEIDLRKTLVSKFVFEDEEFKIEYEGLNMICFDCGKFGHKKEQCPLKTASVADAAPQLLASSGALDKEVEDFGPWMIARKYSRSAPRKSQAVGRSATTSGNRRQTGGTSTGTRFAVLENMVIDNNHDEIPANSAPVSMPGNEQQNI
ncbi:uncharacterized protein LOC130736870 [Lotus japonicus]|uniref:uncharacterized protein LOC130736870 n=1 Tax=Lotus japonicus TaxID=34305 RepID=UPI0025874D48|nr:uncharacterized protein LOC130736870 [Lotus japonicus]